MKLPIKYQGAETSIFTVMSALANEHKAVNLSQGFPDYPINENLKLFLAEATKLDFNQYAPMAGFPSLIEQILLEKSANSCLELSSANVTICPGASYGIFIALSAILERNDEVIILEPAYDAYIPAIELNGGIAKKISLQFSDFAVDWDLLKATISDKTKVIIVNTPHNPTGAIWTKEDWATLGELISGREIVVLSDEVYEHLVFDNKVHASVLAEESLKNQFVAVYSFGKQFNATGWKIGYTIASEEITKAMRKVHQYLAFAVNAPAQYALAKFMEKFPNLTQAAELQSKRDFFIKQFVETPLKIISPSASTYFQVAHFGDWKPMMSDVEFAHWLTREVGVASIPMSAFYHNQEDNKLVRFCFAKKEETLKAAIDKIKASM